MLNDYLLLYKFLWFFSHKLSALATSFQLISDTDVCENKRDSVFGLLFLYKKMVLRKRDSRRQRVSRSHVLQTQPDLQEESH